MPKGRGYGGGKKGAAKSGGHADNRQNPKTKTGKTGSAARGASKFKDSYKKSRPLKAGGS